MNKPIELMTVSSVRERIRQIEKEKGDWEVTHSMEDALLIDVLSAIAENRCISPRELAEAVLKLEELNFPKWYA